MPATNCLECGIRLELIPPLPPALTVAELCARPVYLTRNRYDPDRCVPCGENARYLARWGKGATGSLGQPYFAELG